MKAGWTSFGEIFAFSAKIMTKQLSMYHIIRNIPELISNKNDNLLKYSINNISSPDEGGEEVGINEPSTTSCLVNPYSRVYEAYH